MSNGDPSKNDIALITYVTLTTCEKCYGICCDLLLFNIFLFSFLDAIVYPWLLLGRWKAWWHHRDCRPGCKLVNFFVSIRKGQRIQYGLDTRTPWEVAIKQFNLFLITWSRFEGSSINYRTIVIFSITFKMFGDLC